MTPYARRAKRLTKHERSQKFAEAKTALAVIGTIAGYPGKPVVLRGSGGRAFGLAVRVGDHEANYWRPIEGYEIVDIGPTAPWPICTILRTALMPPSVSAAAHLAAITRRAFLPNLVAQIQTNPTLGMLNTPKT